MLNIRRFLSRFPLRAREVRIIRGVCRQIDWYTGQPSRTQNRSTKSEIRNSPEAGKSASDEK
jgi:tRNA C32,U32 (ribose-2'-O)-methylase TrmJ